MIRVFFVSFPFMMIAAFWIFTNFYNLRFDMETNSSVRSLTNQIVRTMFKTHCIEDLREIFTDELMRNFDNVFPGFFHDEAFYIVVPNYMRTLYKTDINQWYVHVRVHYGLVGLQEGLLENWFSLSIGFERDEHGAFVVNFVGRGR